MASPEDSLNEEWPAAEAPISATKPFGFQQLLTLGFRKKKDLPYLPPRIVMRFKVNHIYKHAP